MLAKIWKLLYDISLLSPICAILFIISILKMYDYTWSIIYFIITILSALFAYVLIYLANRFLPPIPVKISAISPNDTFYGYLFTYGIPLIVLVFNLDNIVSLVIIVFVIVTLFLSNSSIPNPILRLLGFHFYTVDLNNGLSGYTLITKQQLINLSQVKTVFEASEFLLLDGEIIER